MRWLARKLCEQPNISRWLHWLGRLLYMASGKRDPDMTEKCLHMANTEWAEDDTYMEKLCLEVGCSESETYGDSYCVPSIQDKADLIGSKLREVPTSESDAPETVNGTRS
jgi:hypothetical protein